MIRLPKLFKRKTQADDLDLGSVRGRRTAKNPTPRSFQRAAEAEELALTAIEFQWVTLWVQRYRASYQFQNLPNQTRLK